MIENGCQGCNERKVGCHSHCEKYKKWLEQHNRLKKEAKRNEKRYYDYFYK